MADRRSPVLRARGVSRTYHDGSQDIRVLDAVDVDVSSGEKLAITGESGSGKSTFLHLAAGMDLPDAGTIELLGEHVNQMPEPDRTRFRARNIGLVFQDYNLIESLSAGENIELVGWLTGKPTTVAAIRQLAGELGISELLGRRPDQLSGGQQQRVAIARALIHQPSLVLADEPTGSLDQASAEQVMEVLSRSVVARGCALILVTHSETAAARCDRRVRLQAGKLETA